MLELFDWSAKQYSKFEKERTLPCVDLVHGIHLQNPKTILDVGCGIGNSTAVLQNVYPNAEIIGADASEDMLERARKNCTGIQFVHLNFETEFKKWDQTYDVIFSNACIHWISNHNQFIPDLFERVNEGGVLAIQIPLQNKHPVYQWIDAMCDSKEWKDKIRNKKSYHTLKEEEYYDILSSLSNDFRIWQTNYYHVLDSHASIIEWYKGSGFRPYLEQLSDVDQNRFLQQIYSFVKNTYKVQKDGKILFPMPRLFMLVKK